MMPKIAYLFFALLNGTWMIFDGTHVLLKGKYFGPPEPGPWSKIVAKIGIDPFSLGPVFIFLGIVWIVAAIGIMQGSGWSWTLALIIAIGTLWYIPIGSVLALLAILLLWFYKSSFV
jgi:hypothetical protein